MKSYISAIFVIIFFSVFCAAQNKSNSTEKERFKLAANYSKNYRGLSVLVMKGDKTVFEEYQNGHSAGNGSPARQRDEIVCGRNVSGVNRRQTD
jgi:hypothetical protein